MGRSIKTLLIIVSFTILCSRCYGTLSNISKTNWANAHMHCREEGKMLPNLLIHTLSNDSYFWTGHYTRLSGWIKIIGCFEETIVNNLTKKSYQMYFPSAGRCQEVCLAFNYSVFGVQLNTCVCLEKIPGQRIRGSNNCSSTCSSNYPTETNITFQNDCGGHKAYSLFKSGSEMKTSAFTTQYCLFIQCSRNDQRFIEQSCEIVLAQICNKTYFSAYSSWQSSSATCKSKHNSYLLGNVDLTKPKQTCNLIQEQPFGPSWLGIAKELYISTDGVKDDMVQTEKNPIRCLKCSRNSCTFADCSDLNYFVCMKSPGTTYTTPTGTTESVFPHETVPTSSTRTGTTKSTSPHGTVFTCTTPTCTTKSTSRYETVPTSTTRTATTKSTSPHGTVFTSTTPTYPTKSTSPHGSESSEHSTISISEATEGSTNKKNESMMNKQDGNTTVIMVVVPVTVIVILGLFALLVTLWRRQIKKTSETRHAQHEPSLPNHSEKSDTNHSLQNNYFVLDKTEKYSVVNSTNHAKDKSCRSPHNECHDDDYDHLGENLRKEEEEEDTYHHAFFPSNEDESDYGIRNISDECKMENPYSHTNTGAYHVALADNECNTFSINA